MLFKFCNEKQGILKAVQRLSSVFNLCALCSKLSNHKRNIVNKGNTLLNETGDKVFPLGTSNIIRLSVIKISQHQSQRTFASNELSLSTTIRKYCANIEDERLNLRFIYDYFTNNDWRGNCDEKKCKNKTMNTLKTNKDKMLFPIIVQIFCAKQIK